MNFEPMFDPKEDPDRGRLTLLELTELIASVLGERTKLHFAPWRSADQRYYVSDTRRFESLTGWSPKVSVREDVTRLLRWLEVARTELKTDDFRENGHVRKLNGHSRDLPAFSRR